MPASDLKITALTAIGANPVNPATFPIPMVDLLDNSMAASGSTRKVTVNQILGSGGTATLASATITGDLTVRTTGLTVNSSGVGVGTSSQSSFLGNSPKKLVIGDGTQTPALTLYGGSTTYSGIYFADGTVGNEAYRGFIEYDHNVDGFNVGIAGTSSLTLNSTGNLVLKGGTAGANGVGVTFPITPVASSNAKCLDDYEEGTFTPTVTFGGASVGMIGTFSGRYTKVGRAVTVSGLISLTARGTSTGNATIGGLPFTSAAGDYVAASLRLSFVSFTDAFQGYIAPSNTVIILEQITNAGTDSSLTHSNFSVGSSFLIWNCTYTV